MCARHWSAGIRSSPSPPSSNDGHSEMTHGCLKPIKEPRLVLWKLAIIRLPSLLLTAVLAETQTHSRASACSCHGSCVIWMPTAGITRADAEPICATPDKISKALASGRQLFFAGPTAECSARPDCFSAGGQSATTRWHFLDFGVFENRKLDNHLTPQHTGNLPIPSAFGWKSYQGKSEKYWCYFLIFKN